MGGLQVRLPGKEWEDVSTPPGCLLVNIGKLLFSFNIFVKAALAIAAILDSPLPGLSIVPGPLPSTNFIIILSSYLVWDKQHSLLSGDMMQRWSNDSWRSTLHRVVSKQNNSLADNRRQSMAFFVNPGKDVMVN